MTPPIHTILGANGVIGRELSRELAGPSVRIRQVSRSPLRINASDELVTADLLDPQATSEAVAGSEVCYLVAGLTYDVVVWETQWPKLMKNAIEACSRHRAVLVFFDNVYAYGRVQGVMTEDTPYNPCSRKGEVRARIATTMMDAVKRGDLRGFIVRSADFYGPGAVLSFTHATVTERLRAKKAPQWVGDPKALHSFTFTRDAARTLAGLARRPDASGQVWHALTSAEPMAGEKYVDIACEIAGRPYALQTAPRWLVSLIGVFSPVLRESREMLYQFEYDYQFGSEKAQKTLGLAPTSYRQGIADALRA